MSEWTTERVINKISKPYPLVFPTTFDLLPLMSFQQVLDPDLSLHQFVGSVSISLGSKIDYFRTKDHDIEIGINTSNPRETGIKFNGEALTQKALWNEVLDNLGADFVELNTTLRIPIVKATPKSQFGLDSFWLVQKKRGNFTRSLRRRFGLYGINNAYLTMKNELKEKGMWKKNYQHKLRGVLKTTNAVGNDGKKLVPWENFLELPTNHRFPPAMNELNDSLVTGKWWADCGVPVRLLGATNSFDVEAVIYMLKTRKILIAA